MNVYLTIIAIVKLWLQGIEYRFVDFRISYFVFRFVYQATYISHKNRRSFIQFHCEQLRLIKHIFIV